MPTITQKMKPSDLTVKLHQQYMNDSKTFGVFRLAQIGFYGPGLEILVSEFGKSFDICCKNNSNHKKVNKLNLLKYIYKQNTICLRLPNKRFTLGPFQVILQAKLHIKLAISECNSCWNLYTNTGSGHRDAAFEQATLQLEKRETVLLKKYLCMYVCMYVCGKETNNRCGLNY